MSPIITLTLNPAVDVALTADRLEPDQKIDCRNPVYHPGGGGINVARVVHRLGGATLAWFAGGGPVARLLHGLLDDEGVPSRMHEIAATTRQNISVTESETGNQFRLVLPGAPVEEMEMSMLLDRLCRMKAYGDIVAASGSLPPGAPADTYARVAACVHEQGSRFALDTRGPSLLGALGAPLWLLKTNEREMTEAGRALHGEDDWRKTARRIVAEGKAEIVMVSLGAGGAAGFTREAEYIVTAPKVEPVSTIGAGDSFMGAALLRFSHGRDLRDALRLGAAAGTAAVLTPATELCRPRDVWEILPEVAVREGVEG
ncbi:1-phosphofructokinase family hexose kinase [Futiania mangrovi]|uniref:Phosphofructokinase n=1 Tax=Futiania mangrovi TaxID=2959716 RepID=A0A9J6PC85_9PROT|nr:1-phosphofructokinase family hexose kinase [Futiania mangrovii]MCP1335392.1 1-phosphofructokinase family hexose kinase [Futiania mangrovii]